LADLGLTLPLPARGQASALLAALDAPVDAAAEIVDGWPSPDDPIRPDLADAYDALVARREYDWGAREGSPWFFAYVFLAAVEHALTVHAARGIPEDVSWATLRDFGRSIRFQAATGDERRIGAGWLRLHFRGDVYRLGRLQFELKTVDLDGTPFAPGTPALSVHIPDEAGPLDPRACDESFAWARDFFSRHFPETPYDVAYCSSWLLDPQLEDYLGDAANIVRFQRRFTLTEQMWPGDEEVFRFVFHRLEVAADDVPQRTTLERALVAHVRAGRHWHGRTGWLDLRD
jgi:hypothetical protein